MRPSWGVLGASCVNPSAKLPGAPQPFWLEGPLEPPFGRTFSQPCTLQRAYANIPIYQSKSTFLLESHSFLERVLTHVAWQYIRTGQDRAGGGKEHLLLSTESRTYSSRPNTRLQEHCAFYYAKEVVINTDEPASWGPLRAKMSKWPFGSPVWALSWSRLGGVLGRLGSLLGSLGARLGAI